MKTNLEALKAVYVKNGGNLTDTYEDIAGGAPVSAYKTLKDAIAALSKLTLGGGGSAEIPWMTVDASHVIYKEDGSSADYDDFKNGAVLLEKRSGSQLYYYVFPCEQQEHTSYIRPQMIALNSSYDYYFRPYFVKEEGLLYAKRQSGGVPQSLWDILTNTVPTHMMPVTESYSGSSADISLYIADCNISQTVENNGSFVRFEDLVISDKAVGTNVIDLSNIANQLEGIVSQVVQALESSSTAGLGVSVPYVAAAFMIQGRNQIENCIETGRLCSMKFGRYVLSCKHMSYSEFSGDATGTGILEYSGEIFINTSTKVKTINVCFSINEAEQSAYFTVSGTAISYTTIPFNIGD